MLNNIFLIPLLALNIGWESKDVEFTWTPRGSEYEYIVEVYIDRGMTEIYFVSEPVDTYHTFITFRDTDLYFVKIKYYIPSTDIYGYEYIGQKYIDLEHEYIGETDDVWFPPQDELPPIPPIIEEEVEESVEENNEEEKDIYSLPLTIDMREEIVSRNESVLGQSTDIKDDVCNIYIFKSSNGTDVSFYCNLGIKISKVEYLDWGNYLTLDVSGTYLESINASVKVYECKKFSVTDPLTWFECKKILVDSYEGILPLRYIGYIQVDGISQSSTAWGFGGSSFFVRNIFTKDIYGKDIKLALEVSSYVKGKEWIDVISNLHKSVRVPKLVKATSTKPFSFPFEKYIGVNQWYGCTVYQCPHKGIDFGAYLRRVISIGEGIVVSVGYDKYGGECYQGGKYVIVKHTNGMHSTYFHLDSYSVKVGSKVKVGTLIGISGNTGKWNCQNLGYHLHFETRKGRLSSTHVNPVKYINADWNSVPTLNYKVYPGRLTGENPHPNF